MVIIDYRCRACGVLSEAFVASPAPAHHACAGCGGVADRRWSSAGLMPGKAETAPAPRRAGGPLCATAPDVPGLCHMSETAGRAWIARARGDHRALDAEYARQERSAQHRKPSVADAISHGHHHAGHEAAPAHAH